MKFFHDSLPAVVCVVLDNLRHLPQVVVANGPTSLASNGASTSGGTFGISRTLRSSGIVIDRLHEFSAPPQTPDELIEKLSDWKVVNECGGDCRAGSALHAEMRHDGCAILYGN